MGRQQATNRKAGRAAQLLGLLLLAALLPLALSSSARAQEDTVVRMELEAVEQPIPAGTEFEVSVLVDNVEHLAGFDFTISYDPKRVKPVEDKEPEPVVGEDIPLPTEEDGVADAEDDELTPAIGRDIGQVLTTSERGGNLLCTGPSSQTEEESELDTVFVSCVTLGPPVCLNGSPGSSGSGVLGRLVFESKGGGFTTLELTNSTLAMDDAVPCEEPFEPPVIPHDRGESITVELIGGGGLPWIVIGPVIGVAVLVLIVGGFAGYRWYQGRGAGTTA